MGNQLKYASKCQKCKKGLDICKVGFHGSALAWRTCCLPCSCGEKYYEEKPVLQGLFRLPNISLGHPGLRPRSSENEAADTIEYGDSRVYDTTAYDTTPFLMPVATESTPTHAVAARPADDARAYTASIPPLTATPYTSFSYPTVSRSATLYAAASYIPACYLAADGTAYTPRQLMRLPPWPLVSRPTVVYHWHIQPLPQPTNFAPRQKSLTTPPTLQPWMVRNPWHRHNTLVAVAVYFPHKPTQHAKCGFHRGFQLDNLSTEYQPTTADGFEVVRDVCNKPASILSKAELDVAEHMLPPFDQPYPVVTNLLQDPVLLGFSFGRR
ncbi:predicted protein [Chaetomium globosum CBS 148.51]|uniref:Uncharacterized protein n=1 Tax=Chaetomium globosum (strain ATCC 6205 / CBS 148.51 / DSM 1962 / NBRC 6347 / NRRL 1970) TaxID=306901 RepID=Q2H5L2_CHAGB|nr:uncharacterized protein CHGG_06053 [Chaetomium globosum CBS 148.51]EAQ89434.1 predicted protein [Chaetomium globosum CBS 148.51]